MDLNGKMMSNIDQPSNLRIAMDWWVPYVQANAYIIWPRFQGQDRLEFLPLDVASDASVKAAAETVREKFGTMYAIVNNAGVGFQNSMADTLNINTYGPKRVCDHFLPLLDPKDTRIWWEADGKLMGKGKDEASIH